MRDLVKPVLYLETSFWGRLVDRVHADRRRASRRLLRVARRSFELRSSNLVVEEIKATRDPEVRKWILRWFQDVGPSPVSGPSYEVKRLAGEMIRMGGWSEKVLADLTHVAYAIRGRADAVVSWNLAHLASGSARAVVRRYCRINGWPTPLIGTPEEVLRWHAQKILS